MIHGNHLTLGGFMMKRAILYTLVLTLICAMCAGCIQDPEITYEGTNIVLSNNGITVDGAAASTDSTQAVYVAHDIVYYEAGHDFTYGEGTEADAHSVEEAAAHTVVHITQPGLYILSGTLSMGQIAVDLGENAAENPSAVVNLVLMNASITCTVAPAIIFYNVYECGSKVEEIASANVNTSKAGANIILPEGTRNTVNGSYVAKIYKPDSVELSEDGKEVLDAKKLHKYDGAVYSRMSMNIGSSFGYGQLDINAANEGLDSELHLTINGGYIKIRSGNDGINTNEDNISVTTINGGTLDIVVTGQTGEGDGIDSNGWLVINGGSVYAQGCATSGDAGIDSDRGIHINGGFVFATGNMLDRIGESKQNYAVFQMAQSATGNFALRNSQGNNVLQREIYNSFTYLVISCYDMTVGDYTLWQDGTQLEGIATENMGGQFPGGMMPPEGMEPPEGMTPPEGNQQRPEGQEPPEGQRPPDGQQPPEGQQPDGRPDQGGRPDGGQFPGATGESSATFTIQRGGSYFVSVRKTAAYLPIP